MGSLVAIDHSPRITRKASTYFSELVGLLLKTHLQAIATLTDQKKVVGGLFAIAGRCSRQSGAFAT
jgi:hypothetical protein